ARAAAAADDPPGLVADEERRVRRRVVVVEQLEEEAEAALGAAPRLVAKSLLTVGCGAPLTAIRADEQVSHRRLKPRPARVKARSEKCRVLGRRLQAQVPECMDRRAAAARGALEEAALEQVRLVYVLDRVGL